MGRAASHGGQGVGHGQLTVVVRVDAQGHVLAQRVTCPIDDCDQIVRERAAVGVAQDDAGGPRVARSRDRGQGILAVGLEAVEEVLGVVEDAAAFSAQVGDRFGDHGQVLAARRLQHLLDVQRPALAKERHPLRAGLEQRHHGGIALHRDAGVPRRAEGRDFSVIPGARAHLTEELGILGIRAGPTTLDVVDAQPVELGGDLELVGHGERDTLALRPVAQCRVVDSDPCHGSPPISSQ